MEAISSALDAPPRRIFATGRRIVLGSRANGHRRGYHGCV
jgi:hypothetical protein